MEIPESYNDNKLLFQLSQGDEPAFAKIYNQFYGQVLYYARRYVPEAEAQDITTETFLQLWRKRADFQHVEGLAKFLFITARNRCLDELKHKQVKSRYANKMVMLIEHSTIEEDYLEHQIRMDLMLLLQKQVDQLPPKMQEIFLLSLEQGLKPAQIAEQLGISVKTVKNQKLSAIKLLKKAIAGHPLEMVFLALLQYEIIFTSNRTF